MISTFFTLKLNGVHLIKSTTRLNVTMRTIGKTLEENPIFSTIILNSFALIGKLELLLVNMKKGVHCKLLVLDLMAGKSKNTIHYSIKRNLALSKSAMEDCNALFITLIRIEDMLMNKTSSQL